jgi:hypothetical protein
MSFVTLWVTKDMDHPSARLKPGQNDHGSPTQFRTTARAASARPSLDQLRVMAPEALRGRVQVGGGGGRIG